MRIKTRKISVTKRSVQKKRIRYQKKAAKNNKKEIKKNSKRFDYFLKDPEQNWALPDYEIDSEFMNMENYIDNSMDDIFMRNGLDEGNADYYDKHIESAKKLALERLEQEHSLRTSGIGKMLSWQAKDIMDLKKLLEYYSNEKSEAEELLRELESKNV